MTVTRSFADEFVAGFIDGAPSSYNHYMDCGLPDPWCAPWLWASTRSWFDNSLSAYDMGRGWAEWNRDELEAFFTTSE